MGRSGDTIVSNPIRIHKMAVARESSSRLSRHRRNDEASARDVLTNLLEQLQTRNVTATSTLHGGVEEFSTTEEGTVVRAAPRYIALTPDTLKVAPKDQRKVLGHVTGKPNQVRDKTQQQARQAGWKDWATQNRSAAGGLFEKEELPKLVDKFSKEKIFGGIPSSEIPQVLRDLLFQSNLLDRRINCQR